MAQTKSTVVTLTTVAPTEYVSGEVIPASAVIEYKFFYKLDDNSNGTQLSARPEPMAVVNSIVQKDYDRLLTVTATVIVDGIESEDSEVTEITIPAFEVPEAPEAPEVEVVLS